MAAGDNLIGGGLAAGERKHLLLICLLKKSCQLVVWSGKWKHKLIRICPLTTSNGVTRLLSLVVVMLYRNTDREEEERKSAHPFNQW